jgi:hypothetical protein
MRGMYKRLVLMLVLFIFSFCILTSPASAKTDPRIPKNKIVVLVYDDSGSMWEQPDAASGKKLPIDNWKYANYALQSFVALMDTEDQLKVVFMSSPKVTEPFELDEKLRQFGIDQIRAWNEKKSTPLHSLHTALNELNTAADSYDHSDFWLIVLTDGIFNEINHLEGEYTKEQIEKNKNDIFKKMKDLKSKMDQKEASFQTTLIPIETYLKPEEQIIMEDFKRQWKESSDGLVLESEGQLDIIDRINEVAALMTNRDPSEQEQFELNPVFKGNQLILESPFPLRRISVMEQSAQESATFQMKEFYMNNKRIEQGMEGPYKIKTPEDPERLNPPIRGTFTHLKNVNGDAIIESGSYKIVFDKPITKEQQKNIQVLAEPAIDFKMELQKINEDGSLTSDPSLFFQGSKMRIETTLLKSESSDEEIDIREIDVQSLFEVEAQVGDAVVPLTYDQKLNKFIGDFTLTQTEELPIKTRVNIKGFYEKVKETSLKVNPVRQMELVAGTDSWGVPLNKLDKAEPFKITPMINGEEITTEELTKIIDQLKIETPGSNIGIEKKQEGNQILIYPRGLSPLFRTSVGEIPLDVTLPGQYPNEIAEETFHVTVKDVSVMEKFGPFIGFSLLFLFLLWYLFGIWKKPRFESNRISIEYKRSKRKGRIEDVRGETLDFQTNFFSKWLVPYLPEKKAIYDLTFKAHSSKDRVLLTKECQEGSFIVKYEKLNESSNKRDIAIFNNDEVRINRGAYESVYIFKSQ